MSFAAQLFASARPVVQAATRSARLPMATSSSRGAVTVATTSNAANDGVPKRARIEEPEPDEVTASSAPVDTTAPRPPRPTPLALQTPQPADAVGAPAAPPSPGPSGSAFRTTPLNPSYEAESASVIHARLGAPPVPNPLQLRVDGVDGRARACTMKVGAFVDIVPEPP
jgi:hypothetical protein